MTDLDKTLEERGKTYGEFLDNATVAMKLKRALRDAHSLFPPRWFPLPPDVAEAMEMICVKMSRIVSGNPEYPDNWKDIAGYAMLVYNRLQKEQEVKDASTKPTV